MTQFLPLWKELRAIYYLLSFVPGMNRYRDEQHTIKVHGRVFCCLREQNDIVFPFSEHLRYIIYVVHLQLNTSSSFQPPYCHLVHLSTVHFLGTTSVSFLKHKLIVTLMLFTY